MQDLVNLCSKLALPFISIRIWGGLLIPESKIEMLILTLQVVGNVLSGIMYSKHSINVNYILLIITITSGIITIMLRLRNGLWSAQVHSKGELTPAQTLGSVGLFFFLLCISQPLFLCYSLCLTFQLRLPLPPTHFLSPPFLCSWGAHCINFHLTNPNNALWVPLPQPAHSTVSSGCGDAFIHSSGWGQDPALGFDKGHLVFLLSLMTGLPPMIGATLSVALR